MDLSSTDTTYVALAATILPPDLHPYASAAGLCHLRITSFGDDQEACLIEVAALPHRLHDRTAFRRVFTVWVNTGQLAHALPWDRTLQNLPTCDVRERLEAGISPWPADDSSVPDPVEPGETGETHEQGRQAVTLLPLPELFLACETVNEVVADGPEPPRNAPTSRLQRWMRLVWLRAALAMVRRQLVHTRQVFHKLDVLLEKVIEVQRQWHQSLVSASAVYVDRRLVGWRLQIAYPMQEVLAA
ncbi:MAG TPA: hypothetical protein VFA09_03145 [Ktedonobacteraceae bacterium]|jgi:hypothetical protein|nr:hypothetical protein [Ktedonobacteraceae bacterium]HZU66250.1 hypothetical protein [Ktedonobacteraceae bacterium]